MQIEWSDKEQERLRLAHDWAESAATAAGFEPTSKECQRRTAVAVASCAVELVAARGGTWLTAAQIASMYKALGGEDSRAWSDTQRWCSTEVGPLVLHAREQGVQVATLRQERDDLRERADAMAKQRDDARAEAERLKARKWIQCTSVSNDCLGGCASMAEHDRYRHRDLLDEVENVRPLVVLHEDLSQQLRTAESEAEKLKADLEDTKDRLRIAATDSELAESRLAATREALDAIRDGRRFRGEHAPEAIAKAALALEGDAPQEAKDAPLDPTEGRCAHHVGPAKRPCYLPPGHNGSHTARGDGAPYPCSPTCTHDDAATPGHPERVRQKSEAVIAAAASLDGTAESLADAGPEDVLPAQSRVIGPVLTPRDAVAYEEGAEAMRTACWEIVQTELRLHGWGPGDGPWTRIKAAIEGATP